MVMLSSSRTKQEKDESVTGNAGMDCLRADNMSFRRQGYCLLQVELFKPGTHRCSLALLRSDNHPGLAALNGPALLYLLYNPGPDAGMPMYLLPHTSGIFRSLHARRRMAEARSAPISYFSCCARGSGHIFRFGTGIPSASLSLGLLIRIMLSLLGRKKPSGMPSILRCKCFRTRLL